MDASKDGLMLLMQEIHAVHFARRSSENIYAAMKLF